MFRAVAQMRHTEAVATLDADILVGVADPERLHILTPAKDLARVLALRECRAVTDDRIAELAARHGLSTQWQRFLERFDAE